jgi:type IV secretory pathway VirB10-like protein
MTNIIKKIFGKPKMPDTSAQDAAQVEAMNKQTEILDKQEARLEEEEKTAKSRMAARSASRRKSRGGYRLLLSSNRANAQTGIKGSGSTLGG